MEKTSRRQFILKAVGATALGFAVSRVLFANAPTAEIMTVSGPIDPATMGLALTHEHIMSIFGGPLAEIASYEEEKLFTTVIPYLKKLHTQGVNTLCDCTAAYFGRRPDLLKHIATETGLHILTNTGYYGAANDRYVPDHAQTESADQLAQRWLDEWENGIGETGIRPGFIKIGVDSGTLPPLDEKLVRAAARTHHNSGLTIASHTSGSIEAMQDQLRILEEEHVLPTAWIWVHAHNVQHPNDLLKAAEKGAWISLDGLSETTLDHHLTMVTHLKTHGYFKQILLSHDGNSFRYGDRPFKPYDALLTHFIPKLKEVGYTDPDIQQLTVENPRKAFTIRIRQT